MPNTALQPMVQLWLPKELLSPVLWFRPPEMWPWVTKAEGRELFLWLEPSVCHHGVAGRDPCSAGKASSPSREQMVRAGWFLALLTRGWSDSKAVGDANLWDTGSPALPEPAPHSGQQQQVFWLYLGVPYTAAFPSMGRGVHL